MTTFTRRYSTLWAAMFVLNALAANAAVVSTTGDVQQLLVPPATVMPNAFENDNIIWIFTEKLSYTLTAPLVVNISAPVCLSRRERAGVTVET